MIDIAGTLAISVDPGNTFVWWQGEVISWCSPLNGLEPDLMPRSLMSQVIEDINGR